MRRKWSFSNTDTAPCNFLEGARNSTKDISQDSRCPSCKTSRVSFEYKSRALPIKATCTVPPYLIVSTILFAKRNSSRGKASNSFRSERLELRPKYRLSSLRICVVFISSRRYMPGYYRHVMGLIWRAFWIDDRIY
jgi:hypothetical protein